MCLEKTIPLIVTGETFCVTLSGFTNEIVEGTSGTTATNVVVDFTIPDGLTYLSSTVPRGSYNPGTKRWTVGNILPGEVLSIEMCFTISDGCKAPYTIVADISSVDACEADASDNQLCYVVKGLSCCDLNRCNNGILTNNDIVIVPNGYVDFPIDISGNDDACPDTSLPTYQWSDLSLLNGTISGLPDNAIYTPDADFCGVSIAKYQMLCNGNVQGEGTVLVYVSCPHGQEDHFYGQDGVTFTGSVANNDIPCSFGATTTYHLVTNPSANSAGLTEATSQSSVQVISWNQATGEVSIVPEAGWSGIATFQYFIRCTSGGVYTDSDPVTVHYVINSANPLTNQIIVSNTNYVLNGSEKFVLVNNSVGPVNVFADAADFYNGSYTKELNIKVLYDPAVFGVTFTNTRGDVVNDTIPSLAVTNYIFTSVGESIRLTSDENDFYVWQ